MGVRVEGWRDDLDVWLEPFVAGLGDRRRRRMCPLYIAGLIGPGDRKSIQPMAARQEAADPPSFQWTPMLAFRSWRGVSDECSTPGVSGIVQAGGR